MNSVQRLRGILKCTEGSYSQLHATHTIVCRKEEYRERKKKLAWIVK